VILFKVALFCYVQIQKLPFNLTIDYFEPIGYNEVEVEFFISRE